MKGGENYETAQNELKKLKKSIQKWSVTHSQEKRRGSSNARRLSYLKDTKMPCYHPVTAFRSKSGCLPNGKWPIVFNSKDGFHDKQVTIPCGRCIGCRLERSRQWAIRCTHEATLYSRNCFITLTYDENNLPDNGSLNIEDITNFIKRLRKKYGKNIRFFQCGEYGENTTRPHHHINFFNFKPEDLVIRSIKGNKKYYTSESINQLWKKGHSIITDLTFETAAYTARYITKKILGKQADMYYDGLKPEYITMSRKPGIGKEWWNKYKNDILVHDKVVVRANLIVKPAKYYDKLYDLENPEAFAKLKQERIKKSLENTDNTPERLAIKEQIKNLKNKQLKRNYENANL